jgi:hypothetical protein
MLFHLLRELIVMDCSITRIEEDDSQLLATTFLWREILAPSVR